MITIDCISDLHGFTPDLGGADILVIAGDLVDFSERRSYEIFMEWVMSLDYGKILITAGNHDTLLEKHPDLLDGHREKVRYLVDETIEFDGVSFHFSPWTLEFQGMNPICKAFTCKTEKELAHKWRVIPFNVDVLVTHSPPFGICDKLARPVGSCGRPGPWLENAGSPSLFVEVMQKRPKYHIFGHIHEGHGSFANENTLFLNVSHVEENYIPIHTEERIVVLPVKDSAHPKKP